jgi:voltage-gated potassium channel
MKIISKSTAYLLIGAAAVILLGTYVMYEIESKVPDTKIKTLGDSLWWVVETVTTVGYGDIVPISPLGRMVALVFMFGGILLITTIMSVVSTTFYQKRMSKEENRRRQEEFDHLKTAILNKLSNIEQTQTKFEQNQAKFNELVNDLRSSFDKRWI